MRLAFITNWHLNMQRPHHWVVQAVSRGHEAEVYSPPKHPWRPLLVPYDYASRIYLSPSRILERAIARLLGPNSKIVKELRSRAIAREVSIWQKLWNGESDAHYDAIIFCRPPSGMVQRKQSGVPLIYDCVDQWDSLPGSDPKIQDYEDSLAAIADMIWAVTANLAERLGEKHGSDKCHVIPNGCDYNHFAATRNVRRPE